MLSADRPIVLVTGACGYIGAQLIRDLAADPRMAGATVRVLDNLQGGRYESMMGLPSGVEYQFIEGDILDPAAVRLAMRDVDTVIHLAAIVRTPMSFQHPTWVEQVNHWGTARLVESSLDAGVRRFIYASSASVYGVGGPFKEGDACRPIGAYSQSKRGAEAAVLSAASRGLSPVVVRLGTAFGLGPVTRFDAVVNRFAWLAGVRRSLPVYGNGDQVRPFIHVADASGVLRFVMGRRDIHAQILNAVGVNATVQDVVEVVREVRPDISVHYTEQDVITHPSFEVDASLISSLGWSPSYTLHHGVQEITSRLGGLSRVGFDPVDVD